MAASVLCVDTQLKKSKPQYDQWRWSFFEVMRILISRARPSDDSNRASSAEKKEKKISVKDASVAQMFHDEELAVTQLKDNRILQGAFLNRRTRGKFGTLLLQI